MGKAIKNKYPMWVHSWQVKDPSIGVNVIGVKEQVIVEYEDGTMSQKCGIRIYKDPVRPFYVTKTEYRDHQYKREFEDIDRCDRYMVKDSELEERIQKVLYPNRREPMNLNKLCASPYLYVADIDTQTLIRQRYKRNAHPDYIPYMTTGTYDIENHPITHEINLITYSHMNVFYTGVLKSHVREHMGNDVFEERGLDDIYKTIKKYPQLTEQIQAHNIELNIEIFEHELDLIKWIFSKIHKHKTDFIGIWNIAHDIPTTIERIKFHGARPEDVMCPPILPEEYRYIHFKLDERKDIAHFTDRWHWCTISGYSQFIDKLNLYARLRKASGRDVKYTLDYIGEKELGFKKLDIAGIISHVILQLKHFLDYIAYNIGDCVLLHGLNHKNNDMATLHGVTGFSHISRFNSMGVLIRDYMYDFGRRRGKVPGTSNGKMFTDIDKLMPKTGGTVLPPNKAIGVTVPIIDGCSRETQVCIYSNDIDVSSQYPSVMITCNISKDTCLASAIKINGYNEYDMELFFSGIIDPNENAVALLEKFYHLPNYEEFDRIYQNMR